MGGLVAGASLAGLAMIQTENHGLNAEYIFLPLLIVIFFFSPVIK